MTGEEIAVELNSPLTSSEEKGGLSRRRSGEMSIRYVCAPSYSRITRVAHWWERTASAHSDTAKKL